MTRDDSALVRILTDPDEVREAKRRARAEFRDRVAQLMLRGHGWTVQRHTYHRWWGE